MITNKQKKILWEFLDNFNESELPEGITYMMTDITPETLAKLRMLPGFLDIESSLMPKNKENEAKSLFSKYSNIEDIPPAYRQSFLRENDMTMEELQGYYPKFAQEKKEQEKQDTYKQLDKEQKQRKEELEKAQELSTDKSFLDNALALGLKLTPKEADKYYVRHGLRNNGAILDNMGLVGSAALGGIANLLELIPVASPVGIGAQLAGVPILRQIQEKAFGEEGDYDTKDVLTDLGMNALSQAPVKELYDVIKGPLGSLFGTGFEKSSINKGFQSAADAVDRASKGSKEYMSRHMKERAYDNMLNTVQDMDKLELERLARNMEQDGFPAKAAMVRKYNTYANEGDRFFESPWWHTKKGDLPDADVTAYHDEIKNSRFDDYVLTDDKRRLKYNNPTLRKELEDMGMSEHITPSTGWLNETEAQNAIDKALAESASKKAKVGAAAVNYAGRPALRILTNTDGQEVEPLSDEERRNLERQWALGFVPRGHDPYYEAWKKSRH